MSAEAVHTGSPNSQTDRRWSTYLRRLGAAVALGLPGLLALAAFSAANPPAGVDLAAGALFVAALLNNGLLLLVTVALGAYAAPRVGLRSHLLTRVTGDPAERPDGRLRAALPLAVGLGTVGAVVLLVGDALFAPFLPAVAGGAPATLDSVLAFAPVRFLYGGVAEELMVRFGLMSVLAFVGWRLLGRGSETLGPGVMWGAVVGAALLFGLGHLPATAASLGLTTATVARALLLNGLAGVIFGWLYWRRSLEAAIASHVTFHIVFLAVSLAIVL